MGEPFIPGEDLPEAPFQVQVLEVAELYRWRAYHTYDSRRSTAGFPDLVLLRPPEVIFAELKTDKGRLSPDQQVWIGELTLVEESIATAMGIPVTGRRLFEAHVWRPSDFDAIVKRLGRPYLEPIKAAA